MNESFSTLGPFDGHLTAGLLVDELPRPAAVPVEARQTVPAPVVVLVPRRSTPPRAA